MEIEQLIDDLGIDAYPVAIHDMEPTDPEEEYDIDVDWEDE